MIGRRALLAGAGLLVPGCARAQAPLTSAVELAAELHHGLLFARGQAGKAQGWFLVDTGAPVTVLDRAFARTADVDLQAAETLRGVGGSRSAYRGAPTSFAFEGGPSSLIQPSVVDLAPVAARMGVALAGVAGGDVLSRHVVTLDYRAAKIVLSPRGALPAPAGAVPMRVGRTPWIRAVAVLGQRRAPAEFQIDTGANTAVVLWRDFARRAFPDARLAQGAAAGVAGVETTLVGRLDALEIGSTRIANLGANFGDRTQPDDAGRDYGGVIGGPAWTNLAITVDYPGGRFWVA